MNGVLEITIAWFDDGIAAVHVQATNGLFSGSIQGYANLQFARELSEGLRGFPSDVDDTRSFELGSFVNSEVEGGARLSFRPGGPAGRFRVEIELRSSAEEPPIQSTSLWMHVAPASIDRFVHDLERMELAVGRTVRLDCSR
jgi:hypothetical protein